MTALTTTSTFGPSVGDDPVNGSSVLHLGGKGAVPTVAVNTHAGTAGSASLDTAATDLCGKLTVVTGSAAWATGTQATVTFGTQRQNLNSGCYVVFSPADANTAVNDATVLPYVTLVTNAAGQVTGFNLAFQAADSAAHTYNWNYLVAGV